MKTPKFFFAKFTILFNHLILQKLKAALRALKRKRLSFQAPITADFRHKKFASSLATFIIAFILGLSSNLFAIEPLAEFSEKTLPIYNQQMQELRDAIPNEIKDNDSDTKIQTEENADEDIVRIDTGGTERFILDANGRRTMPTQPAFLAIPSATQTNIATGADVTVVFDTEIFDVGSNFAANTFTAPVTGKYLLATSIRLDAVDTGASYYVLKIITTNRTYQNIIDVTQFNADLNYWCMNLTTVADMDVTNTAYVAVYQGAGTVQTDINHVAVYSYFSGALLF